MVEETVRTIVPGRVDVVIPIYNQEQWVGEAVTSVLNQTYKNFRLFVVNDGSTDRSRLVVQEAIDVYTGEDGRKRAEFLAEADSKGLDGPPRWALYDTYFPNGERPTPVVIDKQNAGLSEARNTGIRHPEAVGEFILPLDSDDMISPDYLEKTVPKMSDLKVGIVSTDMQYFGLLNKRIPPKGLTLQAEMQSNDLPVCSLIRRKAFEQIPSGYETIFVEVAGSHKVLGYEDWNLWLDILKRGWTVAVVNEPLFHYRVRPNSMISQAVTRHSALTRLVHLLHPDLWPNG
jgi:glycosyltransferase involved in cell wall biosynthesis